MLVYIEDVCLSRGLRWVNDKVVDVVDLDVPKQGHAYGRVNRNVVPEYVVLEHDVMRHEQIAHAFEKFISRPIRR